MSAFSGVARAFVRGLIGLVVLALVGVVLYLASDLNQRHYRLTRTDEVLVIERGRFFPMGFVAYTPDDPVLQQAYAPIVIAPGQSFDAMGPFEDRSEVDRALFQKLSQWATERLLSDDPETLALGIAYVKRLEILPGLSEENRHALRGMRADAALRQAEGLMQSVALSLKQAQLLFAQALELGTQHPERARTGLSDITRKLEELGEAPVQHKAQPAAVVPAKP